MYWLLCRPHVYQIAKVSRATQKGEDSCFRGSYFLVAVLSQKRPRWGAKFLLLRVPAYKWDSSQHACCIKWIFSVMYLLFSLVNAKKIFCSSLDLSVSNNLFIRFPFYFFSLASALDVGFLRSNKSTRPNGRNLVCKRISPLKHSWISGFCVHTLTVRKTVLVTKILLYCSYSSWFCRGSKHRSSSFWF